MTQALGTLIITHRRTGEKFYVTQYDIPSGDWDWTKRLNQASQRTLAEFDQMLTKIDRLHLERNYLLEFIPVQVPRPADPRYIEEALF